MECVCEGRMMTCGRGERMGGRHGATAPNTYEKHDVMTKLLLVLLLLLLP